MRMRMRVSRWGGGKDREKEVVWYEEIKSTLLVNVLRQDVGDIRGKDERYEYVERMIRQTDLKRCEYYEIKEREHERYARTTTYGCTRILTIVFAR